MELLKNAGLFILTGLGWLLLEVLGQVALEALAALGWVAVRGAPVREPLHPALLSISWGVVGVGGGAITLLFQPERMTPPAPILGLSLVVGPLLTGAATHLLGRSWRERGRHPPQAFNFAAGAGFAFGVALARFSYLVLHWPWG